MHPDIYIFNKTVSPQTLEALLKGLTGIKWFHGDTTQITWFDTFESALLRCGFYLHQQKGILTLEQARSGQDVYSMGYKKRPQKLASIPPGGLHEQLASRLDGRALMPIVSVDLIISSFNFIDDDGKILAQGRLFDIPEKTTLLILRTIRGYGPEVAEITHCFPANKKAANIHEALFGIYDVRPTSYRSKPELDFSAYGGMAAALHEILHANFMVMRQNEEGVIKDIDIEFLHDFRVAGRRMRSALSLIKGVLKGETAKTLKNSLKQIGVYSGPLRDLDVYLLKYDDYAGLLPEQWDKTELQHFFRGLKIVRSRALTRLRRFLKSDEYRAFLGLWTDVLSAFDTHIKKDPLLRPRASRLIHAQFNHVLDEGGQLNVSSVDEAFHELRIDAKKLRYLLEFFQSLYTRSDVDMTIKQLKSLQDNLGTFNDLSVQIEFLEKQINRKKKTMDTAATKTLSAIIGALNYEKRILRQAYGHLYTDFSSSKNQRIYAQLFKEGPDEGDIIL